MTPPRSAAPSADHVVVEPEVAGGLGERTEMDRGVHPPVVTRLHYRFDGWLGDAIVESFPVFLVTEAAGRALEAAGATGLRLAAADVDVSDTFAELHPDRRLPPFVWLKPVGVAGRDDVATASDGRLVLSAHAVELLGPDALAHALIEPLEA